MGKLRHKEVTVCISRPRRGGEDRPPGQVTKGETGDARTPACCGPLGVWGGGALPRLQEGGKGAVSQRPFGLALTQPSFHLPQACPPVPCHSVGLGGGLRVC